MEGLYGPNQRWDDKMTRFSHKGALTHGRVCLLLSKGVLVIDQGGLAVEVPVCPGCTVDASLSVLSW